MLRALRGGMGLDPATQASTREAYGKVGAAAREAAETAASSIAEAAGGETVREFIGAASWWGIAFAVFAGALALAVIAYMASPLITLARRKAAA